MMDPRFIRHTYIDRLREVVDFGSDTDKEPARASSSFPGLLYFILRSSDQNDTSHIVSWQPHGRSFAIRDKDAFVSQIMSKYFNSSRFSSFQKQLNVYGFTKMARGPDRGGWYHEYFLRGRPDLLTKIKRLAVKGRGVRKIPVHETEPDFYAMPYSVDLSGSSGGSDTGTSRHVSTSASGSGSGSGNGSSSGSRGSSSPTSSEDNKSIKDDYSSGPGNTAHTTTTASASASGGDSDPTGSSNHSSGESDVATKSSSSASLRHGIRSATSQFPASRGSDASVSGSSSTPNKKRKRDPLIGTSSEDGMLGSSSDDRRNGSSSDEKPTTGSSSDEKQNGSSSDEKQNGSGSSSDEKQNGNGSSSDEKQNGGSSSDEKQNYSSSDDKNNDSSSDEQQHDDLFLEDPTELTAVANAIVGSNSNNSLEFDFGDDQDFLMPTSFAMESAEAMYADLSAQGFFFVGSSAGNSSVDGGLGGEGSSSGNSTGEGPVPMGGSPKRTNGMAGSGRSDGGVSGLDELSPSSNRS